MDRDQNETRAHFVDVFASMALNLDSLTKEKLPTPLPYDFFCPSVMDSLEKRTCNTCKIYFATQKMMKEHKKVIHNKKKSQTVESSDESSDEDEIFAHQLPEETAPIIDVLQILNDHMFD